jgi:hypothetical protein
MSYDITLTHDGDGAPTVTLTKDVTIRRTFDTSPRYQVHDIQGQTHPTVTDFGMIREIIEVRVTLAEERLTTYADLNTLIRSAPKGSTFTLVRQRKTGTNETYSCVPYSQCNIEARAGEGEMDYITCQFLVVNEVLAG